jgi:hypothetical protein
MNSSYILTCLAFFPLLLINGCSDNNAGTSSNTTNSLANIQITDAKGLPTRGKLRVFDKQHSKLNPKEILEFKSDTLGLIDFDKKYPNTLQKLPNLYTAELTSSDTDTLILWRDSLNTTKVMDTLELESPVFLSGDLDALNPQVDSVWILLEGTDLYVKMEEDLRFTFPKTGKGNFELKIIYWDSEKATEIDSYPIHIYSEAQHFSLQTEGEFLKD